MRQEDAMEFFVLLVISLNSFIILRRHFHPAACLSQCNVVRTSVVEWCMLNSSIITP